MKKGTWTRGACLGEEKKGVSLTKTVLGGVKKRKKLYIGPQWKVSLVESGEERK